MGEDKNIDGEFYTWLEYHLSKAFSNSSDKKYRWLWCDGIETPLNNVQSVIENKMIITKAFVGLNGQDSYEMILKLGKCALSSYKKGLSLIDCVPSNESLKWVLIDVENKKIELQLD